VRIVSKRYEGRDIALNQKANNLSQRLLLSIGTILFITQGTTIIWLLHEVREQLTRAWLHSNKLDISLAHFDPFGWEALGALFFPALAAFSLSLLISWIFIKRIVSPLNKLTEQLQQRHVEQWQPFESDNRTNEVAEITQALNGLMQKLQLAFARERQFTADVSHELRTPIAGIRLNLELIALQHSEDVTPLINRLDSMQRTIDQLLAMARLEQQMVMGLQNSVDLVQEVILPQQRELIELVQENHMTLSFELPKTAFVVGDKTLLSLLLRNLIENSSRYADTGSVVNITLETEIDCFRLIITDVGVGVDEAQIMALTDAFQRFDQRGNGVGLGLNIVARVCTLHKATLQIENHQQPHGLKVKITFPTTNKKG
jgi:two-component system sensor histidine kinase BasS